MADTKAEEPTCTWGESVHLGWLIKRGGSASCPNGTSPAEKARHTMMIRLEKQGLVSQSWQDGELVFTITESGRIARTYAHERFVGQLRNPPHAAMSQGTAEARKIRYAGFDATEAARQITDGMYLLRRGLQKVGIESAALTFSDPEEAEKVIAHLQQWAPSPVIAQTLAASLIAQPDGSITMEVELNGLRVRWPSRQ
jgi:hypothetical protein